MGTYAVTQAQRKAVANLPKVGGELDADPSEFKGSQRPVEKVSWDHAVEFCERLSQHTGREYRLPTEAEWEYACRAGTTTPFYTGETLTSALANYNATETHGDGSTGEYRGQTTDVGSFPANAFGLYDMHGNVWEWCQDQWRGDYNNAHTDGSAWMEGIVPVARLLRGSYWKNELDSCRSAYHASQSPAVVGFSFRVVCAASQTP